jgi:hypothetical protein
VSKNTGARANWIALAISPILFAEVDILSCVKDTPYRDFEDLIETIDNYLLL